MAVARPPPASVSLAGFERGGGAFKGGGLF